MSSSSLATVLSCLQHDKDPRIKSFHRYCCIFACGNQRYYQIDELFALLDSVSLALPGCIEVPDHSSPYAFVYLPDDSTAEDICSRSFIMKKIMRHWVTVRDQAEWNTAISRPYKHQSSSPSPSAFCGPVSTSIPGSEKNDVATFVALQAYIHHTFGTSPEQLHPSPQRFKLECHRYGKGKGFTKAEFEDIVDQIIEGLKVAARLGGQRHGDGEEEGGWRGVVDLESPDVVLCFWEVGAGSNSSSQHVGRLIFDNSRKASKLVDTFHLRKGRPFLGPTSMDCELAFIMCTLGVCRPGTLVLDPFCGSASILVSAARLGAQCLGCDIDMRILSRGGGINKSAGTTIADNFSHYGLPVPDILCASQNCRAWRRGGGCRGEGFVDAIVTDPPYGVRAGARKIMATPLLPPTSTVTDSIATTDSSLASSTAIVSTYSAVECLDDLLDLAAEVLVMGGRLVFFVPSSVASHASSSSTSGGAGSGGGGCSSDGHGYSDADGAGSADIAQRYLFHPCLERVSCSEDRSSVGRGKSTLRRHLVVMRKVAPYWFESGGDKTSTATNSSGARSDSSSSTELHLEIQSRLKASRAKRDKEDKDDPKRHVCVRDVGTSAYKNSRRKF